MELTSVRILIVDDFQRWRAEISQLLQERSACQIVGEACDGLEAIQKSAEFHPDVVLLDIRMPRMDGITAAREIRRQSPNSRIVFVTADADQRMRDAAIAAGGHGYVLKLKASADLIPAIIAALADHHGS